MNNKNNNIPKEPDFSWLFKDIKKEHPELKAGQFWTIFRPEINDKEIDETETGQIVLIMEIEDNNIFIVPVHATESTRTILDPLISEECHNLHSYPIVAVVTMAQNIGKEPFKTARFVGEITKEGLEIVKESYNKYLNAIGELAIVQYKDAHDIELTDEEEAVATKAGIYKLCPVNGDIDSLIEFNNEISEILQPWHVLAMAEMFAGNEAVQNDQVAEPPSVYESVLKFIIKKEKEGLQVFNEIKGNFVPMNVCAFSVPSLNLFRGSDKNEVCGFSIDAKGVQFEFGFIKTDGQLLLLSVVADVDSLLIKNGTQSVEFKKIGQKWIGEILFDKRIEISATKNGEKINFEIENEIEIEK